MTTTVTTASSGPVFANGTAPIPFTFQSLSETEIRVTREGEEVDPEDYTVTRSPDGTGSITPLVSWGSDEVMIYSNPSFQQTANFSRFGAFYPDLINPALDRLARTILAIKNGVVNATGIITGYSRDDWNGNPEYATKNDVSDKFNEIEQTIASIDAAGVVADALWVTGRHVVDADGDYVFQIGEAVANGQLQVFINGAEGGVGEDYTVSGVNVTIIDAVEGDIIRYRYLLGSSGATSISPYDMAVNAGFVGTVDDWLDSLVGDTGPQGRTIHPGTGAPSNALGADGDFYIDTNSPKTLYGPKAAGVWPAGVSLKGDTGATGAAGVDGVRTTLAAHVTNATTTPATVFSYTPPANAKFEIEAIILLYAGAATTNCPRLAYSTAGGYTYASVKMIQPDSSTASGERIVHTGFSGAGSFTVPALDYPLTGFGFEAKVTIRGVAGATPTAINIQIVAEAAAANAASALAGSNMITRTL